MITQKTRAWFLYFWLYSFLGWCYEVFLEVVIYRWGFSNRGFLFGPYCPVYGFGALLILFTLGNLRKRRCDLGQLNLMPVMIFVGIILLTTVVELLTSYIMEWTTGGWLWDYTSYSFQFQGRIALNPSIRFGIGGMVIMYILQPFFEKLRNRIGFKNWERISVILFLLMAIDFIYTVWLK